jgi:hypothetical protein
LHHGNPVSRQLAESRLSVANADPLDSGRCGSRRLGLGRFAMSGVDQCPRCGRNLASETLRRLYRRGLKQVSALTPGGNETLCFACFQSLRPEERRQWLLWASALTRD